MTQHDGIRFVTGELEALAAVAIDKKRGFVYAIGYGRNAPTRWVLYRLGLSPSKAGIVEKLKEVPTLFHFPPGILAICAAFTGYAGNEHVRKLKLDDDMLPKSDNEIQRWDVDLFVHPTSGDLYMLTRWHINRPLTAYFCFHKGHPYHQNRRHYPRESAKAISEEWKKMSVADKQPYMARAQAMHVEYNRRHSETKSFLTRIYTSEIGRHSRHAASIALMASNDITLNSYLLGKPDGRIYIAQCVPTYISMLHELHEPTPSLTEMEESNLASISPQNMLDTFPDGLDRNNLIVSFAFCSDTGYPCALLQPTKTVLDEKDNKIEPGCILVRLTETGKTATACSSDTTPHLFPRSSRILQCTRSHVTIQQFSSRVIRVLFPVSIVTICTIEYLTLSRRIPRKLYVSDNWIFWVETSSISTTAISSTSTTTTPSTSATAMSSASTTAICSTPYEVHPHSATLGLEL